MSVKIEFSQEKCEARIKGAWDKGLFTLSSQILGDCNQYVKVDQHTMEASSYTASKLSEGRLVWDTPYARRQYWEIRTSLTPGRTWKWCETAKRKFKTEWEKLASKLLKENL